jgi:hypothetical protein
MIEMLLIIIVGLEVINIKYNCIKLFLDLKKKRWIEINQTISFFY